MAVVERGSGWFRRRPRGRGVEKSREADSGRVASGGRSGVWFLWLFTLFWNGVSLPGVYFLFTEELPRGNYLALLVLLFPLVGLGLLYAAVKTTLEWLRFGPVELAMDPYPGAIGGDMAGTIELGYRHHPEHRYHATLSCLHVHYSGSGKNRSRSERLVWQEEGPVEAQPTAAGSLLRLRFRVPEGLPPSEEASSDYHTWRLELRGELPGVDLERSFELPMVAGGGESRELHHLTYTRDNGPPPELPPGLVRFHATGHGPLIHYPAGRMKGGALGLGLMGVLFGGVPLLILSDGEAFAWPFAVIFGLVGLLMLAGAVWMPFNSLWVLAGPAEVVIERRLFGIPLRRRHVERSRLERLVRVEGSRSNVGSKVTQYYQVVLRTRDGESYTVGENIPGTRLWREVAGRTAAVLGVPVAEE